jgi:lauroyl/myristoyl acyltransferase
VDAIGQALGCIAYHLFASRRKTVMRNLRIAWGDSLDATQLQALVHKTFRYVGANLLGGMRCMVMDDKRISRHVTIEGREMVQTYLTQSETGAIFALVHMGNWEILARIGSLIMPSATTGTFFRPLNNPLMNRMTMRRRAQSGTQLFSNKESFSSSCDLVRNGGMLGILADQHAGRSACHTPFFGRMTACTPLVDLLHRRTGAQVFFVSVTRDRPAHWHIKITVHEEGQPITTPSIMRGLEKSLSLSPCDGFWLHNRWKLPKRKPFNQSHSRYAEDGPAPSKPWRYALIRSADPAIASASDAAIHHLRQHLADDEVHIITATEEEQLSDQLLALDYAKSYPLDMVIYFCPRLAEIAPHRLTDITMSAGFGSAKANGLDTCIPLPTTAMDDPQTWWDFMKALGCSNVNPTS